MRCSSVSPQPNIMVAVVRSPSACAVRCTSIHSEVEHLSRLMRSEEHTSELQSPCNLVCRLLLEKKHNTNTVRPHITTRPALPHTLRMSPLARSSMPAARRACLLLGLRVSHLRVFFFFFNDTATTEIYTLSLHDALPISVARMSLPRASLGFDTLNIPVIN